MRRAGLLRLAAVTATLALPVTLPMTSIACTPPDRARPCFTPADATPGWKEVALPASAPALAAPPEVEQYRPGEPAMAWHDDYYAQPSWSGGEGTTGFQLDLEGEHWDAVELTFESSLANQEIEALAGTAVGRALILPRTRSRARVVRLELPNPQTASVTLIAHHHLRPRPALVGWRAGRWQRPAGRPATLVYRQPLGPPLQLCQAPDVPMAYHPSWQPDAPSPVTLTQTLNERMRRYFWW